MGQAVIAAGHQLTATAAGEVLRAGGNAFDAIAAGFFAACVAEPVLTSLGGGGFLNARTADDAHWVYDFFCQTPQWKRPAAETDFHPIIADFGPDQQEFHIGQGAVATPGAVAGVFAMQAELGRLPMTAVVQPAVTAAREGVALTAFQAYVFQVVEAIYGYEAEARALYGLETQSGWRLLGEGEIFTNPALADVLEALAREGSRLFYEGELATLIAEQCAVGGHLRREDLAAYEVVKREPLSIDYAGWQVLLTPPPASGGLLIALGLELLRDHLPDARLIAETLRLTQQARVEAQAEQRFDADGLLNPDLLETYRAQISALSHANRGTTHLSVLDAAGNAAAMTVSNGEGCGQLLPGCGFMLNNMLGEADLHPEGFHQWCENQRLTSMMCPSIALHPAGDMLVLGSGGSNRIRSALLQVLANRLALELPLDAAIEAPRLHFEDQRLSIEGGFDDAAVTALDATFPDTHHWASRNLFFGGVHAVERRNGQLQGHGDSRRDGTCLST